MSSSRLRDQAAMQVGGPRRAVWLHKLAGYLEEMNLTELNDLPDTEFDAVVIGLFNDVNRELDGLEANLV